MQNYLLTIQYKGTNYYGWGIQPNKATIVSEITKAIKKVYKDKIELRGSGRTDRGVHAYAQCASVILNINWNPNKLKDIINKHLPNDIQIIKTLKKPLDFHARYNAKSKKYQYKVINNSVTNVFKNNLHWYVKENLNISVMQKAAKDLIGKKNFKSFATINSKENIDTIKTITNITITKKNGIILFNVTGKGFMRHMVRKIVATLIAIGSAKESPDFIQKALKQNNCSAGKYKAPPHGLYLLSVYY